MPRLPSKARACKTASLPSRPSSTRSRPSQEPFEMIVEDEKPVAISPINIKEEEEPIILKPKMDPFETEHVEIKVEPVAVMVDESDPTDRKSGRKQKKPLRVSPIDWDEPRCQFCLKLFSESGGQATTTRRMVLFVLGVRKGVEHAEHPDCCQSCKGMFELFNEFKRCCLEALNRSTELLSKVKAAEKSKDIEKDFESPPEKKIRSATSEPELQPPEWSDSDRDDPGFQDDVEEENVEPPIKESPQNTSEPVLDNQNSHELPSTESALDMSWLSNSTTQQPKEPDTSTSIPPSSNENLNVEKPRKRRSVKSVRKKKKSVTSDDESVNSGESDSNGDSSAKLDPVYKEGKQKKERKRKEKGKFPCTQCPERLNTELQLTLHVNRHLGIRTVACRREGCDKKFFDTQHRFSHEKGCGKDVKIMCTVCGAIFRSMSALRTHMASHGELKFFCKICGKGFYRKVKLDKHASVHSDERKYECLVCGKRFKSKEANRVHQRTHTEERPFACHLCGKAFRYNCGLKAHMEKGHDPGDLVRNEVAPTVAAAAAAAATAASSYGVPAGFY